MYQEARILSVTDTAEDVERRQTAHDPVALLKEHDRNDDTQQEMIDEMQAALKVLLDNRERERAEIESSVVANVRQFMLPVIEKLKNSGLRPGQAACLDLLETSLHQIVSPFLKRLNGDYAGLTSAEQIVASLVKEGKSSKEIAEFMNLSLRTIDTYRNRIRKKLGINGRKVNLRDHLLSLEQR